jgi:hypothetical protein
MVVTPLDSTLADWVEPFSARYGKEAPHAPVSPTSRLIMTTPYRRALVSFMAVTTITLALGACARASSLPIAPSSSPTNDRPLTIRFDNDGRQYVHVYLVNDRRQWLLGRVEAMSKATLRIPEEVFAESPPRVRLAVISGERPTFLVAKHPRAALTSSLPASAISSWHWWFAKGELMSLGR